MHQGETQVFVPSLIEVDKDIGSYTLPPDVSRRLGLLLDFAVDGGAVVLRVEPNSLARKAGFRSWDVIQFVNGASHSLSVNSV